MELRGAGNCSRQVHNFGTPAALEADRFIVAKSSRPPATGPPTLPTNMTRRRRARPGSRRSTTSRRGWPTSGFHGPGREADAIGYQRVYASDHRPIDVSAEVRTGDVVLVPYGWHGPAMAAPGYDMYYLNVMAGPGRVRDWLISDDPHHGWVRQTWDSQNLDPRLPFGAK